MVITTLARRNLMRVAAVTLAALLFAGCVSQPLAPDKSTPYMQGVDHANSDYYLQQMQQSHNDSRTNWQLLAIRALSAEDKIAQAQALYQSLPATLTRLQQVEQALLTAQLALAQNDDKAASDALASLDGNTLTPFQQQRYWQAQIDLNHGLPSLALLRALIAQEPLLQGAAKQQNIDTTWQVLTQMSPAQVKALVINADEYTLQGWLDLQYTWQNSRTDPALLQTSIQNWQTRYPKNPAANMLPTALLQASATVSSPIQTVALLLPLNGQGAVFATAIEQGFEMAKNTGTRPVSLPVAKETTPDKTDNKPLGDLSPVSNGIQGKYVAEDTGTPVAGTSAPDVSAVSPDIASQTTDNMQTQDPALLAGSVAANPNVKLTVYDTSTQPIASLLEQVQQDGVSIVVGPLLKDEVSMLQTINTPLNILALNQPQTVTSQPGLCYFSLSPEDEAQDAAEHIRQQGQQYPLLLVPRGQFGERISQAFTRAWQQAGGGTVLQQFFDSVNDLKQQINHNAGIHLTGTPVVTRIPTAQDVASVVTDPPLSAYDSNVAYGKVDAVYIIAIQQELALLKPMITMTTGARSNVAIYVSSRSIQNDEEVDYRMEMEKVQFSDIPLLAGRNPALLQQALTTVHGDYSLARLYAMGVDAWTLVNNFNQLQQTAGFTVDGNTGQLTADHHCVIHRKLVWLKYQQGHIVAVE